MRKIIIYSFLVIVFGLVARVLFLTVPGSGQFNTFETIGVDQCDSIEVASGPEDLQIDHERGLAYISATDRRDDSNARNVGIYVLDLNQPAARPKRLEGELPLGFAPHGISLWKGSAGERRLFVVNHPLGNHSVEIFDLDDNDRLTHLESITSKTFTFPNDIVAVGERQFYMSNMQRAADGIGLMLELYLGLPVTDVVYFDGSNAIPAATGLITANGVNVSHDGTELYVAEVIARRINVYRRDVQTGALSGRKQISINTGPDNIDIAPDGSLFIGAHPNLLAFTKHVDNPEAVSPSQVVRLNASSGEYETVFMSINGELNGSSVGSYWNGNLLVGGVFDSHMMRCQLK